MVNAKVKTTDKGKDALKEFVKRMNKVKGSYVTIGVHEDAGQYEDGTSIVSVALWNEFGTKHIPSRPFMRSVCYGMEADINRLREKVLGQVMDGRLSPEKALEQIGFFVREQIKNKIAANDFAANAPATTAHKKKEGAPLQPLIETHLLYRSIEYKVVMA